MSVCCSRLGHAFNNLSRFRVLTCVNRTLGSIIPLTLVFQEIVFVIIDIRLLSQSLAHRPKLCETKLNL
jgi:hypothetical protein